jgi:hypothetical protein
VIAVGGEGAEAGQGSTIATSAGTAGSTASTSDTSSSTTSGSTGIPTTITDAAPDPWRPDALVEDVWANPCGPGVPPGNLLQNWSFECGSISPWGTLGNGGALSLSTKHVHTGQYSSLTSARTKAYQGPLQAVPLTAGTSYVANAYVYVESPGTNDGAPLTVQITADVSCLDGGVTSTTYTRIASSPIATDEWNYVSGSFTMPACAVAVASIFIEGPEPGIDLYVDDISIE